MTARAWQIFSGLFLLSALAGLVAGRPGNTVVGNILDGRWVDPPAPIDQATFQRDVVDILARSKIFGSVRDDDPLTASTTSNEASDETAAPFPQIQSAALLDGQPVVYLIVEDKVIAAAPGDTIAGAWEILAVSLDSVRAAQSGAEQVFPIFPAEPADPG